jgi:hypothetical protein
MTQAQEFATTLKDRLGNGVTFKHIFDEERERGVDVNSTWERMFLLTFPDTSKALMDHSVARCYAYPPGTEDFEIFSGMKKKRA